MTAILAYFGCGTSASPLDRFCRLLNAHDPTHLVGPVIESVIGPLLVAVIVVLLGQILHHLVAGGARAAGLDPHLLQLVGNLFFAVTLVVAVMAGLTAAGLNIDILLTFGGLASLAVGLAFQDMLRNVIAGVVLLLEKPFRIGDMVLLGTEQGKVRSIALRTTTIRNMDGELIIIPNLTVFSGIIVNLTARKRTRRTVAFTVPAGVDPAALAGSVLEATRGVKGVLARPEPEAYVGLDGAALTVTLTYWIDGSGVTPVGADSEVAEKLAPLMSAGATQ